MLKVQRFCLRWAAAHGFMAISCGAFGAHVLRTLLAKLLIDRADSRLGWMATGAHIQLAHAAALLALAALAPALKPGQAVRAAWAFAIGTLIFSSTLYGLALGGPPWLGAITPVGGLMLLAGWGLLFLAAGNLNAGSLLGVPSRPRP